MKKLTISEEGERIIVHFQHIGSHTGTITNVEEEGFWVVFDDDDLHECYIGYADNEEFELIN